MGRRVDNGTSINLFPFLSILVAIIGCLTLIIVVVTITSMKQTEGKTPEEVTRAEDYLRLKEELKKDTKENADLQLLLKNMIQEKQDHTARQRELALLEEALENQELDEAKRNELIAKYNKLVMVNEKLVADHTKLLEDIKIKEEEIARRKLPPEPAALQVTGVGSTSTSKPYFVEVGNKALYIHRSLTKEPVAIPIGSMEKNEDFINLLKEISSNPRHKLNFLIRGDDVAVKGFERARAVINAFNESNGTQILPGKLPLPTEGKVDLKNFAQFLEP